MAACPLWKMTIFGSWRALRYPGQYTLYYDYYSTDKRNHSRTVCGA